MVPLAFFCMEGNRMLSNNVSTLKLGGIEYPFKCDLIVLEKVQEKYEDS